MIIKLCQNGHEYTMNTGGCPFCHRIRAREYTRLVKRAAHHLGMPIHKYRKEYGQSPDTARRILGMPKPPPNNRGSQMSAEMWAEENTRRIAALEQMASEGMDLSAAADQQKVRPYSLIRFLERHGRQDLRARLEAPKRPAMPVFPADIPCREYPDAWTDPRIDTTLQWATARGITNVVEYAAGRCAACPAQRECEQQKRLVTQEDRLDKVWVGKFHGEIPKPIGRPKGGGRRMSEHYLRYGREDPLAMTEASA